MIKLDDDLVLNTFNLIKFLKNESHFNAKIDFKTLRLTFIGEHVYTMMHPDKDVRSKYYVTYEEYNSGLYGIDYYSQYVHGSSILMTSDLIERLCAQSKLTRVFWMDDTFVGLLGRYVNADYVKGVFRYAHLPTLPMDNDTKIFFVRDTLTPNDFVYVWDILEKRFN